MEKSIIKIVNLRNALLRELGKIKITFEVSPSSANELSKRIKEIISQLDEIKLILREHATFNSEEFANFIRMVLILTEENCALTRLKNKKTNQSYFIVSDLPTRDFILEEIKTEKELEKLISKHPEEIIILRGDKTYPFKENSKMDEQFSKHKRLRIAIYDLIQLKLNNPNISDEQRYQEALNIVLQNNIRNSYIKSTKKA